MHPNPVLVSESCKTAYVRIHFGQKTVFIAPGQGFVVGVRLADDAARTAGHDVVCLGVHTAVHHEERFLAGP